MTAPFDARRFDRRFIEDHQLIARYLENKLPPRGARNLEDWCRAHPEYLEELGLPERTQASIKLLEAAGRPQDLREPRPAWWRSITVLLLLSALTSSSLVAVWALTGKYRLLQEEIEDARALLHRGSLEQPATVSDVRIAPDRVRGLDKARLVVNHLAPQLVDLHIDMSYSHSPQFRMTVDKEDQGRALILNSLAKDSNGELRLTINTTGVSAGTYDVRIEGLPFRGDPIPEGWMILEVH